MAFHPRLANWKISSCVLEMCWYQMGVGAELGSWFLTHSSLYKKIYQRTLVHQPVEHGHGVWHWQIIISNYPHRFAICHGHNFKKIAGSAHISAVLVIFKIESRWRLLNNACSVVAEIIARNTNLKNIYRICLGTSKRAYAVCQVRSAIARWDAD